MKTVEQVMSDPRWKPFWFLRPLHNKKGVHGWQVWDFEAQWYPRKFGVETLDQLGHKTPIVSCEDTAIEAARAALATLDQDRTILLGGK